MIEPMSAADLRRRMSRPNASEAMSATLQYDSQRERLISSGCRADCWERALLARARHTEITDPDPAPAPCHDHGPYCPSTLAR